MRSFLLALACLTLTGCWYGIGLFSASDARPVIPAGDYLATAKDEPTRTMRVSILPDGLTQFDGGEKKETYGFSPLDPASGSYVMHARHRPRPYVPLRRIAGERRLRRSS